MKKQNTCGSRHWLIMLLLALMLVVIPVPSCSHAYANDASPRTARADSVVLSTAQGDSLVLMIDDLNLEVKLAEANLMECRADARADSALAAERLALAEKTYDEILSAYKKDRDSWLTRLLKQPVIWLAVGTWIGVQAK